MKHGLGAGALSVVLMIATGGSIAYHFILKGESPRAGVDPSERESHYADWWQTNLRLYLVCSPELREQILRNLRSSFQGPTQCMRLLFWAVETKPEVRENLLEQWLSDRGESLTPAEIASGLQQLIRVRSAQEITQRQKEMQAVVARLLQIKARGLEEDRFPSATIGFAPVDALSRLDHFPNTGLSSVEASKRAAVYRRIPTVPLDDYYNQIERSLFAVLWAIEADASLRRQYLLPRLERSLLPEDMHENDPNFWMKTLGRFLDGMKESEKPVHQNEIDSLKRPILTLEQLVAARRGIEAEKRHLEEVKRRVAEQEGISTSTKTLKPQAANDSR